MQLEMEDLLDERIAPSPELDVILPGLNELAAVAWDALQIRPPLLLSSLFGLPWTWIPPYRRYSEFQILDLWRPLRTLRYLFNVIAPSAPFAPPAFGPPFLNELFWQPTMILHRPDHTQNPASFPEEAWFFINGILTNSNLAQINAAYLAALFHRPITLIQNSTSSLWLDLAQCAIGKQWRRTTEPAVKAFPVIYDALKDPAKERVVVIAHSQGTIIMATVLDLLYKVATPAAPCAPSPALAPAAAPAGPEPIYQSDEPLNLADFEPLSKDELAKLEVYCFATCASVMTHWRRPAKDHPPIPWIEHFGNEQDIVARLGMLAPHAEQVGLLIDGPRYVRRGAWGHFLDEHYLYPIEEKQRQGRKRGGAGGSAPFVALGTAGNSAATPRLYSYINGGKPSGG
jgi:hypothetical protein